MVNGHRFSHQYDCSFRSAIGRSPRASRQSPPGCGINDRTAFLPSHNGDDFAGHQEDGFYIDGHHRVPIFLADLDDRGSADHARIVEQYVNAAEFEDCAFDYSPAVGRAGHVGAQKDRVTAGGGDFACHFLTRFLVQINDTYCRTLVGKEQRCRTANTARTPSNDGRLAMELLHGHIFLLIPATQWWLVSSL